MSEINVSLPVKVKMSKNQMLKNCLQAALIELLMCYFQLQIYTMKNLDINIGPDKRNVLFSGAYWQKLALAQKSTYDFCRY